ncbi:hypothetical protein JW930_00175 [Candidatus Woesearchaeota archaeon]|nr:hypothetical protein [Candidatus Woesearchaeota archaeon]
MENIFFKYGIIIVGAAVIALLISFSFNALHETAVGNQEMQQDFSGSATELKLALIRYCDYCLKPQVSQDCFIINVNLIGGDLTIQDFLEFENIVLGTDITSGKSVVKIKNINNLCMVDKLE